MPTCTQGWLAGWVARRGNGGGVTSPSTLWSCWRPAGGARPAPRGLLASTGWGRGPGCERGTRLIAGGAHLCAEHLLRGALREAEPQGRPTRRLVSTRQQVCAPTWRTCPAPAQPLGPAAWRARRGRQGALGTPSTKAVAGQPRPRPTLPTRPAWPWAGPPAGRGEPASPGPSPRPRAGEAARPPRGSRTHCRLPWRATRGAGPRGASRARSASPPRGARARRPPAPQPGPQDAGPAGRVAAAGPGPGPPGAARSLGPGTG